jgi:hypothetical protein
VEASHHEGFKIIKIRKRSLKKINELFDLKKD